MADRIEERSAESLRHEYTEITYNIRHYSNIRFAIFSIFFAVAGGLGFVAFGKGQFDPHTASVARLSGLVVIVISWMYEERCSQFFDHYVNLAAELEQSLRYRQYINKPKPPRFVLEAKQAFRVFFVLMGLAWLYAGFAVPF